MISENELPAGIPPLFQYYVYMTEGCNLACQHCWLSPVFQPKGTTGGHLDYELFKLALEEAVPLGLHSVKLTGGEPLLHPDFIKFVDLISEMKLDLTIESNCTLMTPEIAKYLQKKTTLRHISTSLDGAKPKTHDDFRGVDGSYIKTVNGIKALVDVGFKPQVIMSIHIGNVNEISDLVLLSEKWGAGSVKFNLVQPSGRGESMLAKGRVLDIRQLVDIGNWVEHDLQNKVSIPLFYSWPIIFHSLKRLLNGQIDSCGIFNILGILANGSVAMCGIGMSIPELTYGQLGINKVRDIWCENQVLQQLRLALPDQIEGVCMDCLFKRQCLGSCIAENYHQSERLTAPFWFCDQAQQVGVLPIQRTK